MGRSTTAPDAPEPVLDPEGSDPGTPDPGTPDPGTPEPDLDPEDLRAQDAKGNVRPADDRYLTEDQIAARDLHLEEVQTEEERAMAEILREVDSSATPSIEELTLDV